MRFDNISKGTNNYLDNIFSIIREGIRIEAPKLKIKDNENKKNQILVETFNVIGTQNPKMWIGVQKEHIGGSIHREDMYFYLNDDSRTKIFFVEGKRLPKAKSTGDEEYINGVSSTGKPSGGIERFILGIHGDPDNMRNYGIIGYIENKSIDYWLSIINQKMVQKYPLNDGALKTFLTNEFLSQHFFNCHKKDLFTINHFWIDLTAKRLF